MIEVKNLDPRLLQEVGDLVAKTLIYVQRQFVVVLNEEYDHNLESKLAYFGE